MNFQPRLEQGQVVTSVPCRIDFGGTLDLSTFYLPLSHLGPAGLNLALDMRTRVILSPHTRGRVKVSSRGFDPAEFDGGQAPFNHPMGLIFACAQYFNAHGIHISIESASPPRSALGGSSSASVAVLAGFFQALEKESHPEQLAWLSHYIESSVAGVVCGVQDQAAAAFGGANLWKWKMGLTGPRFERVPLFESSRELDHLNDHILVAYCGIPHVSKNINKQWVDSFIRGETRKDFQKIVGITKKFFMALKEKEWDLAGDLMNEETRLRLGMTPEVLDNTGKNLFESAQELNCGVRFAGAGGGGCIWAVGRAGKLAALAGSWKKILEPVQNAQILDTRIDPRGIMIHQL
ncbi:galactokinase [Desulfospira joergensenii]|uniref:GHMP family kinase ATP-binding protein n=1 Tax=Desulfospira joergensenii TaxID=53329 RepID=UPI0003B32902|nr:galactokinase [Desulfospira joergensenii]